MRLPMAKKIILYTAGLIPLVLLIVLIVQEGTQERVCKDIKDRISLAKDTSKAAQLLQQYKDKHCLKGQ